MKGVLTIDGKPEAGIAVNFVVAGNPGKTPASGTTDASGSFKLSTFNTNDGAVPGTYKVTVARLPSAGTGGAGAGGPPAPGAQMAEMGKIMLEKGQKAAQGSATAPLPPSYLSPDTTPLSATVGKSPPGQTEFTIEVSTK